MSGMLANDDHHCIVVHQSLSTLFGLGEVFANGVGALQIASHAVAGDVIIIAQDLQPPLHGNLRISIKYFALAVMSYQPHSEGSGVSLPLEYGNASSGLPFRSLVLHAFIFRKWTNNFSHCRTASVNVTLPSQSCAQLYMRHDAYSYTQHEKPMHAPGVLSFDWPDHRETWMARTRGGVCGGAQTNLVFTCLPNPNFIDCRLRPQLAYITSSLPQFRSLLLLTTFLSPLNTTRPLTPLDIRPAPAS